VRQVFLGAMLKLPAGTRSWALQRFRRPLLWTLFQLESEVISVSSAGPSFCRYPMRMVWQNSTEMALGVYEWKVADRLRGEVRPGDFCIDVGAHIGYHALLMSRLVGSTGKVIAFEPFPPSFEFLRGNAELNTAVNLQIENAALGEGNETIRLCFSEDEILTMTPSVGAYAVSGDEAVIAVPCITLDNYLSPMCDCPNLIQIDVEGAELSVLRGAESTLCRCHPKLLLEIHGWETQNRDRVYDFLSGLGYEGELLARRGDEGFVLFCSAVNEGTPS